MSNNVFNEFKEINAKFNLLKDKAMKFNAVVEASTQQAEKFKEAAMKKFGVDTPEQLAEIIEKKEKENLAGLEKFRKDVEELANVVQNKEELVKKVQEDNN